ncbi:MAG TPA: RHS repeat domain-containing protein, partial [Thermoanaerobaculia bacterium]|nr:RHS repeat domain-containing protein [Thermoanaerobaculia bacterium]
IESNLATNKPSDYQNIRTQIIATKADLDSSCYTMAPASPQIQDLSFSPEATLIPTSNSTALVAYASEVRNGMLGVGINTGVATAVAGTTKECISRNDGVIVYDRSTGSINPRLADIKSKFTSLGRTLNPRYSSVSYYSGALAGNPVDYALIAAGDLGLLAVQVGPPASAMATADQLSGLIWVPQGVYAVRVIPKSHLATIVDGSGRALIVDLTNIDERYDASGNLTTGLFKTAADALNAVSAPPGQAGIDDARIVWASDPGFMQNTLAPIVDPNTGILVSGDLATKNMRVTPAIDPKIKMMIDTGNGLTEVGGVAPAGFDPKSDLLVSGAANASASAFRLEVWLPAGAAKALQDVGRNLELAVESEWTPGVVTAQTPVHYPKAHLRSMARDGSADARATNFILHRDLPSSLEEQVRYQNGATHYVSDWIVAIGDPRASEKWVWPAGTTASMKSDAGCASCERPANLHNKTESQGVYELWSAGRYITVRPDGAIANNVLAGTPYEYLGKQGRLSARFTTTRGRKVRPTEVLVPAHNPPVADGMLQETHYVHSGEVETSGIDLNAGGRGGVDVVMSRHYRSRTIGATELGEGWDSPLFRFILPLPNGDVEYHDGAGEIWKFKFDSTTGTNVAPPGLFLKLIHTQRGYSMLDQKWRIAEFNDLGQLVSESDEFYTPAQSDSGNLIRYLYDETGRLKRILDPLGRA